MTTEITRMRVLEAVLAERERQDAKWGDQRGNSDERWTVILTEEVGEVASEVYEERCGSSLCLGRSIPKQEFGGSAR